MRCRKAREYYFRNRDGLLNEADKMKFDDHMQRCAECAGFVGEMEQSLQLLGELPDMELTENFDWNLKRRIALEKSRLMRSQAPSTFGDRAWGTRFLAGAAAMLVITLLGGWFFIGADLKGPVSSRGPEIADSGVRTVPSERDWVDVNYTSTGYPAGVMMVSDDPLGRNLNHEQVKQLPFSMMSETRTDYLIKENELLRRQLEQYGKENLYLKQLLRRREANR